MAGTTRFLDDGRLELDTNPVENAIRPVCLTRKNALFAGHEVGAENWALLASIVATCKLNDVNPAAYIAETLEAIIDGHPYSKSKTSCLGGSAKHQPSLNRERLSAYSVAGRKRAFRVVMLWRSDGGKSDGSNSEAPASAEVDAMSEGQLLTEAAA